MENNTPIDVISRQRLDLVEQHKVAVEKRKKLQAQLQKAKELEAALEARIINYVQAEEKLTRTATVVGG